MAHDKSVKVNRKLDKVSSDLEKVESLWNERCNITEDMRGDLQLLYKDGEQVSGGTVDTFLKMWSERLLMLEYIERDYIDSIEKNVRSLYHVCDQTTSGTMTLEDAARMCGTTTEKLSRYLDITGDTVAIRELFAYVDDKGIKHYIEPPACVK